MKAVTNRRYGTPDILQVEDVPLPEPGENEIRIQILAAAVNDFDIGIITGRPLFIRLFLGLFKPKIQITGCDIAGRVVEVGSNVTRWQVGDEVFGDLSGGRFGGFAEFVCCSESQVIRKPADLDFLSAAGIPQAGILAWQGLNAAGPLRDGLTILINGAGGGVGTYGVQLARQHAVTVDGVDSGPKLAMLKKLGFSQVFDYQAEDFTRTGKQWDLIIDTKTSRLPASISRALKPGGTYATVGGNMISILLMLVCAPFYRLFTGRRFKLIGLKANLDLDYLADLAVRGELVTIIDSQFSLDEVSDALHYYLSAAHQGKIIIRNL